MLKDLYLFLNRATLPPESTIFPEPWFQAGWERGSISNFIVSPAFPHVERVLYVEPSVRSTVIS